MTETTRELDELRKHVEAIENKIDGDDNPKSHHNRLRDLERFKTDSGTIFLGSMMNGGLSYSEDSAVMFVKAGRKIADIIKWKEEQEKKAMENTQEAKEVKTQTIGLRISIILVLVSSAVGVASSILTAWLMARVVP